MLRGSVAVQRFIAGLLFLVVAGLVLDRVGDIAYGTAVTHYYLGDFIVHHNYVLYPVIYVACVLWFFYCFHSFVLNAKRIVFIFTGGFLAVSGIILSIYARNLFLSDVAASLFWLLLPPILFFAGNLLVVLSIVWRRR